MTHRFCEAKEHISIYTLNFWDTQGSALPRRSSDDSKWYLPVSTQQAYPLRLFVIHKSFRAAVTISWLEQSCLHFSCFLKKKKKAGGWWKKSGLGDCEAVRGVFAPLGKETARTAQGISAEAVCGLESYGWSVITNEGKNCHSCQQSWVSKKCAKEGNCGISQALGSFVLLTVHQGFKHFCSVLEKNTQPWVDVVRLMMSCGVRSHLLHLPAVRSLKA